LLYDSPSGLVFYWTFNNVFALVKNLFYKLKNPGFILKIICGITGFIGVIACTLSIDMLDGGYLPFLLVLCAMLMVPMPLQILFKNRMNNQESNVSTKSDLLYLLAIAYIIILTGILIPSSVISASPEEFVLVTAPQNPVHYVINSMYLSIGFFAVWVSVYYYVLTPKWKNNISKIVGGIVGINTLNYFIFNAKTGIITADLSFDNSIAYDAKAVILQSLACLLVGGAFVLLVTRLPNIFKCLIIAGIISSLGMSIYNISIISSNYTVTSSRINALTEPEITLSKNGRNVVVIMMDWALSGMVPYIFEERPQLLEQYDGFTFYPNTVSFGGHTNLGVPALYGGYEYTPAKLNERSSELLVDKHNEALRVLPVLFSQHGIGTTVIDPPYSDYSEITNVNAYNGYNGIKACLAENYLMTDQELINEQRENARLRNFFLYGIVRVSPLCFNIVLYDEGTYNSLELNNEYLSFDFPQLYHNTCSSDGISPLFLSAYMVLKSMPDITNIVESGDQFLFIDNNTTHEPILLQEPDYVPKNSVDNNAYESQSSPRRAPDGSVIKLDTKEQMTHYHVNMAAYMALGEWFDYLRDNGVWDNTRIIIVSDHGRRLLQFDNMYYEDIDLDVEEVNPILFVKDYYSDGFKVSDAFMTNADVPTIATQGIIDNPINPFTGNPINSSEKNKGPMLIDLPDSWKLQDNMGYVFNKGHWYSVHDNIFDRNNWEYLGEY
ncbi:Sulfatase, partial [Ruminococcaceae bacterium YRB3002]